MINVCFLFNLVLALFYFACFRALVVFVCFFWSLKKKNYCNWKNIYLYMQNDRNIYDSLSS